MPLVATAIKLAPHAVKAGKGAIPLAKRVNEAVPVWKVVVSAAVGFSLIGFTGLFFIFLLISGFFPQAGAVAALLLIPMAFNATVLLILARSMKKSHRTYKALNGVAPVQPGQAEFSQTAQAPVRYQEDTVQEAEVFVEAEDGYWEPTK